MYVKHCKRNKFFACSISANRGMKRENFFFGNGTCKIHYNKINCVLEFRLELVTYFFFVNRLDRTQKKTKSDRNEFSIDKQKLNYESSLRFRFFFFTQKLLPNWSDCFANNAPNRVCGVRPHNINSIWNFKYHNNHSYRSLLFSFLFIWFNCVAHAVMTFYF